LKPIRHTLLPCFAAPQGDFVYDPTIRYAVDSGSVAIFRSIPVNTVV
jgi:hypothetical protein